MDNLTILTSGNQIYAKKRKVKRQQVEKIVFDENARRFVIFFIFFGLTNIFYFACL